MLDFRQDPGKQMEDDEKKLEHINVKVVGQVIVIIFLNNLIYHYCFYFSFFFIG